MSDGTNPGDPNDRNADADNDGLSDLYETETLGTDPNSKDSDGDGVDDGQEAFGLDDRLVTNPLDADTDDDGLLDGEERGRDDRGATLGGTSPLLFDTDKDRLRTGKKWASLRRISTRPVKTSRIQRYSKRIAIPNLARIQLTKTVTGMDSPTDTKIETEMVRAHRLKRTPPFTILTTMEWMMAGNGLSAVVKPTSKVKSSFSIHSMERW